MARELVVIGCSWGGLEALRRILAGLATGLSAAVAVAQHRGPEARDEMPVEILDAVSALPVRVAEDKDPLAAGVVHLAAADYHLLVERDGFALSTDAPVRHSRPSIDVMFESAADALGPRVIAVLLTGANADGAEGIRRLKRAGAVTVAQDPADAERSEMPAAAIATGAVDRVLRLEAIAPFLNACCAPRAGAG